SANSDGRPRSCSRCSHHARGSSAKRWNWFKGGSPKRVHSPPSPRKVGMPLSFERPAPTSATTCSAPASNSAARRISSSKRCSLPSVLLRRVVDTREPQPGGVLDVGERTAPRAAGEAQRGEVVHGFGQTLPCGRVEAGLTGADAVQLLLDVDVPGQVH